MTILISITFQYNTYYIIPIITMYNLFFAFVWKNRHHFLITGSLKMTDNIVSDSDINCLLLGYNSVIRASNSTNWERDPAPALWFDLTLLDILDRILWNMLNLDISDLSATDCKVLNIEEIKPCLSWSRGTANVTIKGGPYLKSHFFSYIQHWWRPLTTLNL